MDANQWRESVLSTRSLSYVSNAGSMMTPSVQHGLASSSRQPSFSHFRPPATRSRRSTLTNESDGDLEMTNAQEMEAFGLRDIPELPESVARSLLFEMPREIRDRIYSYCLTSQNRHCVEWPSTKPNTGINPQLLRTCRIINDEASPLLYSLNTMQFKHPSDANMLARALTSSLFAQHVSSLNLDIRASDTRLWAPYLTSTSAIRNLKADYPNLRNISVRFHSMKWRHGQAPDLNLREWPSDDRKWDEIVTGLKDLYHPGKMMQQGEIDEAGFQQARQGSSASHHAAHDAEGRRRLMGAHRTHVVPVFNPYAPTIRVLCSFQISNAHFVTLMTPLPERATTPGGSPMQLPTPVQSGEPFRGFSPVDLWTKAETLTSQVIDSRETTTTCRVRTPYASKDGFLVAVELTTIFPNKDSIISAMTPG